MQFFGGGTDGSRKHANFQSCITGLHVCLCAVNDVIDDITTDQQRAKCRPTLSLEDQTSSVSATTSESLATTIKNEDEETTARDYTAQDSTTTHDDTADCCRKTQDGTGLGESLQHTTLITTAATKTQDRTDPDASQLADGEDLGSQDRTAGGDAEYKPQDKTMGPNASHLALILKLQRDMATMQLQLSNLQDAMRTANTTLQLLLQRAFADDQ